MECPTFGTGIMNQGVSNGQVSSGGATNLTNGHLVVNMNRRHSIDLLSTNSNTSSERHIPVDAVVTVNYGKQGHPDPHASQHNVCAERGQDMASTRSFLPSDMDAESSVSMATSSAFNPCVSLADKLRLAASKGQIDKVRELCDSGATYEPDREGRTALHYAALNGYADTVKLLANKGCNIDAQDNLGYTALHRAAAQGHLEVVQVLADEGCALDRQDEVHGNAALHEASWNGYSKTLEFLVKHNANVHVINKAGFTALHLAAQNGHNQSARVLLYAVCNSDYRNNYGDTALHTAARYGHAGVTRILLSARCNINEQNKNGDTSLHISAALKRRKISKLLLDAGIDVSIRNKQNETAVDVARRKEHAEIILAITSQPQVTKKKKALPRGGGGGGGKGGHSSDSRASMDEGEKKKKSFFFRKKAKPKEKEPLPADPPNSKQSQGTLAQFSKGGPLHNRMPPHQLLEGFRQHQQRKAVASAATTGGMSGGAGVAPGRKGKSGSHGKTVHGIVNQYVNKSGMQYYRDLAGNIKQGPIGFAPVCSCAPALRKLEQKVEADRQNVYDHVDATRQTLGQRIDELDRRNAQQVYSIDKLTKERLEAERIERDEKIERRAVKERLETERQMELHQDCMKTELKAWVDNRFRGIEQRFHSHETDCGWGHVNGFHRNGLFNKSVSYRRGGVERGRLYRSKSDDTLSCSESNATRRAHRTRKQTMEEIHQLPLPSVSRRTHKFEQKVRKNLSKRESPLGAGQTPPGNNVSENCGARMYSPEGYSNTSSFHESPIGANAHDFQNTHHEKASNMITHFSSLNLIDEESNPNLSDSYAQVICKSEPHLLDSNLQDTISGTHLTSTPQNYNDQHHQVTPNSHDSGSNPDSGYSSNKMYALRRSAGGVDRHNTSSASAGTNTSTATDEISHDSPLTNGCDAEPLHVTRHFFDTVSSQMEKWYERRLNDVEKKAEERARHEAKAMEARLKQLEQSIQHPGRMGLNSGTDV